MKSVGAWGLAVLATLVGASCSDQGPAQPCSDIPDGGCPLSHGVACEDPACRAVYACRAGNVWKLTQTCPARPVQDAGVILDGGANFSDAARADVENIPGAAGGPRCPPLQFPDCALATAAACAVGCCGCEDVFVCQNDGWQLWGTCP